MRNIFYPKLAWTGIRNNKRLYIPYLLTCVGMVMMYYIVSFLNSSSFVAGIPGGDMMQQLLGLGCGVLNVFALIFLFYTNSFLVRRRKKEFGLYNILGMGKRNLARVLLWEYLMTTAVSLGGGLLAGIVFSKFAELGMVNILKAEASFSFYVEPEAVLRTLKLFAVIFLLIFLNTLWQVHLSKPIELLHSEHAGEKPPKANWALALLGAVILGAAYYLAVTIKEPVAALVWFFAAVAMVIVATYLLFIAGSVTICRLLQKNRKYYYKTNHFVSVSSMVYRMKRNGAGLASICILSTMVLVMLSATVCLYVGAEDSLRTRYPRNINMEATAAGLDILESDQKESIRQLTDEVVKAHGQSMANVLDYRTAVLAGYVTDGRIFTDESHLQSFQLNSFADIWQIFFVPLEDYNRLMHQNETLASGEVLIYTTKSEYKGDTIALDGMESMRVKKRVRDFVDNGVDAMQIIPSMFIFVPDFYETLKPMNDRGDDEGEGLLQYHWFYGFDLVCSDEVQIEIRNELYEKLKTVSRTEEQEGLHVLCESVAYERAGFYGLYGGLFFLGILLGAVFLFAAVLLMYYKQVSEGYEDQSRFEIMQKVGMTKKDIRKSINSQILTVFFLPLLAAGVHLVFAFPMVRKLLLLMSVVSGELFTKTALACFLIFALFYVAVYRVTSRAYYSIVSGK